MPEPYRYDPNVYWQATEQAYPYYPTVRHRRRFILKTIDRLQPAGRRSTFDFGCGEGTLLRSVQVRFGLTPGELGGCDISQAAIERARVKLPGSTLSHALYPQLRDAYDVLICCEVIEHSTEYADILRWMYAHTAPGGLLILTTQTGKIHASDRYTGHAQHFKLRPLCALVEETGWRIGKARLWGWPFFTLQKYLTDVSFPVVRERCLEGALTPGKSLLFSAAYLAYCLHDFIPFGPQIYIVGRKPR
ncbi:MAG: class I SAM-dependent methyltransferase [Patescibacteria group bacterium]